MDKFTALTELLTNAEHDAEAFYGKGNNAAGTRLRKAMQDIKVTATEIRKEVTAKKKG